MTAAAATPTWPAEDGERLTSPPPRSKSGGSSTFRSSSETRPARSPRSSTSRSSRDGAESTCNSPSTFAEPDGRESLPRALATQRHFVAVGKEQPRLTVGELDGLVTVGRHFQQASLR